MPISPTVDNIESKLTASDSVKATGTKLKFGPLSVIRGPELPSADEGRNGDIFILDDTAGSSEALQSNTIPSNVGFYQKVATQVPVGSVTFQSVGTGLILTGGDTIAINGTMYTFSGGNLQSLADDIVAQSSTTNSPISARVIPTVETGSTTGAPLAGDALGINLGTGPTVVTFTAPFTVQNAAKNINDAAIAGIVANVVGGALVITAKGGEPITLTDVSGSPLTNLGPFTETGGAIELSELSGKFGFVFSNPLGASALTFAARVSNQPPSATTLGGSWTQVGADDGLFKGFREPARVATTTALINSPIYDNGVAGIGATLISSAFGDLIVDGITLTTGDRIIVKDQVSAIENGIYVVSREGTATQRYILTRTEGTDESDELCVGTLIVSIEGSTNASTVWMVSSTADPITIGIDNILFATLSASGGGTPSSDEIIDANSDTYVRVEQSGNDDTIRFGVGDTTGNYTNLTDQLLWDASGVQITTSTGVGSIGGGDFRVSTGIGGTGGVVGSGGAIRLAVGNAGLGSGADGGAITLQAGASDGAGGTGGDINLNLRASSPTGGTMGNVVIQGTGLFGVPELRFKEEGLGSNYVGFKARTSIGSNAVWTLPNGDGSAGQVLSTDGSENLSWIDVSSTSISDGDGDTYIQVEDGVLDDDFIQMFVGGGDGFTYAPSSQIFNASLASVDITAPSALNNGASDGIDLNLTAGDGDQILFGQGGNVNITPGAGGPLGGIAGYLNVVLPNKLAGELGSGGDIRMIAGSTDSLSGGRLLFVAGNGGTSGDGGLCIFTGGAGGATGGDGGAMIFTGAPANNGNAGDLRLQGGFSGTAQAGNITVIPGNSTVGQQGSFRVHASGSLTGQTGEIRLGDLSGINPIHVGFKSPDTVPVETIWVLPDADGTAGQVLSTDGSTNLSWVTATGGATDEITDADLDTYIRVEETANDNIIRMRVGATTGDYDTAADIVTMDETGTTIRTPDATALATASGPINIKPGDGLATPVDSSFIGGDVVGDVAGAVLLKGGNLIGGSGFTRTAGAVTIEGGDLNDGGGGFIRQAGQVNITGGSGTGSPLQGGDVTISGGAGLNNVGGDVTVISGQGTASGSVNIRTADATTSAAGQITIQSGLGFGGGAGGNLTIASGNGGTIGGGGFFNMTAGNAGTAGNGAGGGVNLTAGDGAGTGNGGGFVMSSGDGSVGGNFTMNSGSASASTNGFGGFFFIRAGDGDGTGGGGNLQFRPGRRDTTGNDGAIVIEPLQTGAGTTGRTSELHFLESDSSAFPLTAVGFKAPQQVAALTNQIWTLPDADGTAGQVLTTDGGLNLSWTDASAIVLSDGDDTRIEVDESSTDEDRIMMYIGSNTLSGIYDLTQPAVRLDVNNNIFRMRPPPASGGTVNGLDVSIEGGLGFGAAGGPAGDATVKGGDQTSGAGSAGHAIALGGTAAVGGAGGDVILQGGVGVTGNGAVRIEPTGTTGLDTGQLRFMELTANGSNYVGFRTQGNLTASTMWTLPNQDATAPNQPLVSNGAGILSWSTNTVPVQTVGGTRAAPTAVTAAAGITQTWTETNIAFVEGSGGAVTVTANPQIAAGTAVGQTLIVIGRSNTNTITLSNGNGLSMNGGIILGEDDVISFVWDGTNWLETSRNA